jgi:DNA-binding CsgD family transcriptional regulator
MPDLTPRQMEVARLVALGNDHKQIAKKLGISPRTARAHIEQAAARIPGTTPPRHRLTFFLLDEEDRMAA